MTSIFLNLIRTIGRLGRERPSLADHAEQFQPPHQDPRFLHAWATLLWVVRSTTSDRDTILNSLITFLQQNRDEPQGRICFSAGCEVSIEIIQGVFCIQPRDAQPVCCPSEMITALQSLVEDYDRRYAA